MSDKQTKTENAARVASNGEEHRNSAQSDECEKQVTTFRDVRIPTDEEEVKRILKTPAPNIWTMELLRSI